MGLPPRNVWQIGRRPKVLPIFAASPALHCQSPFGTIREGRPGQAAGVHETVRCGGKKKNPNLSVSSRTPTTRIMHGPQSLPCFWVRRRKKGWALGWNKFATRPEGAKIRDSRNLVAHLCNFHSNVVAHPCPGAPFLFRATTATVRSP